MTCSWSTIASSIEPTSVLIVKPNDLLNHLDAIHQGKSLKKFHIYLRVTKKQMCWEARGLKRSDQMAIAEGKFDNLHRNFTTCLNNWESIKSLNDDL
jgi:hypothetical protein